MELKDYKRFNKRRTSDRQLDTLIGLSKGLTADGKIDQSEAELLQKWLVQNSDNQHPIIINLLNKIEEMLDDNFLDEEESAELMAILQNLNGEESELGEMAKPSLLPINDPAPDLNFEDKVFVFTGTFAFGSRKECQDALSQLGGNAASRITKKTDYLVLGSYVSESWAHETYGRKIEQAMRYRDDGQKLFIITEEHWINQAGL